MDLVEGDDEEDDDPMQEEEQDAWAQARLGRSKTEPQPGLKKNAKTGKEAEEDKRTNIVERKIFDVRVGKLSGDNNHKGERGF